MVFVRQPMRQLLVSLFMPHVNSVGLGPCCVPASLLPLPPPCALQLARRYPGEPVYG